MRNLNFRGLRCRTKAFHKLFALLCLLLVGSTSWAERYAKVTTSVTPTGSGNAYISTTNPVGTSTSTSATQSNNNNQGVQSKTFYVKAVPAPGYEFVRWEFATSNGSLNITNSTSAETSIIVQTAGSNNSTRENTIRAVFQVEGFAGFVLYSGGNNGEYLANDVNGTTDFNPQNCIWLANSDGSYTNGTYYLRNNDNFLSNYNNRSTSVTLGGTENGTTGRTLRLSSDGRYLRYNNNKWSRDVSTASNVVFAVIKRDYSDADNTTPPTISAALNSDNSGIQFTHTDVRGTYAPAYTDYIFYNNTHHYWYNNATHSTVPSSVSNWTSATYKWSITSGGNYASIDENTGLLTSNGVATSEQTVTVTLTTTEATSGYSNTQTYSVNIRDYAATSTTVLSNLQVEPEQGADLDYRASATYTASVNATQTDVAAYTKYTFNSNTYWCIAGNSTRYTSENDCKAAATTTSTPAVTYTWSLTGDGNANLSLSDNGASATVTHSTPNTTTSDLGSNLSVTASANNQSASLANPIQITARYPHDNPTAINITSANPMTLRVGETKQITYTLTPFPCYDNIRCNISVSGIIGLVIQESGVVNVTGQSRGGLDVTITAKNQDETDGPSAVVHINVHEKIATPDISFAPTESDNGNTASTTISCTTSGANIYYTTDGSTPTTSSTLYEGVFTVNDQNVVKAIAVMPSTVTDYDFYDPSDVATSQYKKCFSADPTIHINGSSVTFSSPDDDAIFYYTTNGNDPTTSSTQWDGNPITTLANETVIKVIAKTGICISSIVVSRTYVAPSGVSGGVVTLNDLEDHTWTYYAGVSSDVDGGNYNTNYAGKLYSPNPRNVKITYKGNGQVIGSTTVNSVKVGIDAPETTFVYYKTIEDNGGYKYTTIPNPFSVRPKIGNTYYGFSSWKVKSVTGGSITDHAVNSTINAETEITFVPSGTYTTNCISMEVELEAVWAVAEVSTSGSFTNNYGVERMFYVITSSDNSNITANNKACTYTSIYPNGTKNGTNAALMRDRKSRSGGFTCSADSKFEYIYLNNNSSTINAKGYNLTIGRGVSNSTNGSVCAANVYGVSSDPGSKSYHLRIESGKFTNLYFVGDNITVSGVLSMKSTLGCDYDRANNNDNGQLSVTGKIYGGESLSFSNFNNISNLTFDYVVKSGKYHEGITGNVNGEGGTQSFYMGSSQAAYGGNLKYTGLRRMTIEGGEFASIAGGMNNSSTTYTNTTDEVVVIRMKGGIVRGSIYGAASFAEAIGIRRFVFTGGTINGWVAAGCNGYQTGNGGELNGDTYMYIGGNTQIVHTSNDYKIGTSYGGNVFGAGSGYSASYDIGKVENSNVVIADNAFVSRNVYGGGNFGYTNTSKTATIYVTGGTVKGSVFGGANQNKGGFANITMTGGNVESGLYGGSNSSGTLSGNVTMQINGGQLGTSATPANVHGGGYGASTKVSGNVELTLGTAGQTVNGAKIYGNVYGGSALGTTGGYGKHTYVTVNRGSVTGNVFGGGMGEHSSTTKGVVTGTIKVTINGTDPASDNSSFALAGVYGGGDYAPYSGTPVVSVHNCDNSIEYVYGGGNATSVNGTDVTIYGGNTIGNVFGGGNGLQYAANVNGNTSVKIYGGTIGNVYGGSNSQGTISGTINLTIEGKAETEGGEACPMFLTNVYGGGNKASSNPGTITVKCFDGRIEDIYGGANDADINGNITLTIQGGNFGRIFGGNNTGHTVKGNVTVNVTKALSCDLNVDYVYGGGNAAAVGDSTGESRQVSVTVGGGAHVNKMVFGGGLGETAVLNGNTHVQIKDTGTRVDGNVYGCGNGAKVTGNTDIIIGE